MIKALSVLALFCALSNISFADEQCAPYSAIVCTINALNSTSYPYYELRTTVQSINSISVYRAGSNYGTTDPALAAAALAKLESQAGKLLAAGVCRVLINNVAD